MRGGLRGEDRIGKRKPITASLHLLNVSLIGRGYHYIFPRMRSPYVAHHIFNQAKTHIQAVPYVWVEF